MLILVRRKTTTKIAGLEINSNRHNFLDYPTIYTLFYPKVIIIYFWVSNKDY